MFYTKSLYEKDVLLQFSRERILKAKKVFELDISGEI
jgi:hypothetical protein